MTEKVLVRIKGYQWEAEKEDGNFMEEAVEVLATGSYHEKNNLIYILYEGYEEEEKHPSKNMIKCGRDFVEIHQNGYAQSTLRFKEGETDRSVYCTPAGELAMETKTHQLFFAKKEEELELDIEYDLEINGMFVSKNRVNIKIQAMK